MLSSQPVSSLARSHVLPAAADRLGEVLLVHHDVHAAGVFVDNDAHDLRGRQRVDYELRRVRRPQDDVDALAGQLGGDGLDAGAAHAHAGADRIDALVVGLDRDLRAHARIACCRLDLQQPLLDLGDFELEQLDEKLRHHAREHQLRPAAAAIDLEQERAHAIADPQILLGNHLVARQHRLDASGLDDRVSALDALDRAGDQMLLAREEVVEDLLALGVADLLQDHLLGGLRADAAELDRLERLLDVLVELDVGHLLARLLERELTIGRLQHLVGHDVPAAEGAVVAVVAVDLDPHLDVLLEALLGRRRQRLLERSEDDVLVDVLLPCQGIDQKQ